METTVQNISEESISKMQASHALVTNVDFLNGKKSSIVTLFNSSDFSFEEIKIGVDISLNRQDWLGITNYNSILYKFIDGKIKPIVKFKDKNPTV